jgi:hypothetical protein
MSWDGLMMRFPPNLPMSEMPADWKPPALGTPSEVQEQLKHVFPEHRHIDGQTSVQGDSYFILFNYQVRNGEGTVESIHVESTPVPEAMAQLKRVCESLNLRFYDCQTGEFADFASDTEASMENFANWRERVMRQIADEPDDP